MYDTPIVDNDRNMKHGDTVMIFMMEDKFSNDDKLGMFSNNDRRGPNFLCCSRQQFKKPCFDLHAGPVNRRQP